MLTISDLERISTARLLDASTLYAAARYDGAFYLAGYSLEFALKARICKTLNWPDYPMTNKEFEPFRSFKVHDLEVLLKLSGYEQVIKSQQFPEWSKVRIWQPEIRYRPIGFITQQQAGEMLNATFSLMSQL